MEVCFSCRSHSIHWSRTGVASCLLCLLWETRRCGQFEVVICVSIQIYTWGCHRCKSSVSHGLKLLCCKDWNFWEVFLSVIYMTQRRGHFVPHCRWGNGSSLCAVVSPPTDHRHFVHFLKAAIQPASSASARWVRDKICPICITTHWGGEGSRSHSEIPRLLSRYCLRVAKTTVTHVALHHNWDFTKYRRVLKCIHGPIY